VLKMTLDLNDIYVKRWLTGLDEGTKEGYLGLIKDWYTFIAMSPTEQINKRMHDLTSTNIIERTFFESKFIEYKESLEATGTNSDSKVHDRIKVVSSFFTRNNLKLSFKKGDWKSTQKQGVKEKKEKLSLDDVKRLYGHANGLRDKCLLLILAQSGFSEIDIAELKIEDINGLYDMAINEHYVIEKGREKTNTVQATCLSYEFLHDLRALLAESGNPSQGYIFTSKTVNKGLEPIDTRRINEIIKGLFVKTFREEKVKGTEKLRANELQTRSLRSFYNGAILGVRPALAQEIKDLLMGHDRGGARNNYQYNDETIREAYIMAFEFLSINGLQSREDLKNLKEDMEKKFGQLTLENLKTKDEHKQELERLNNKITEQNTKFEAFVERRREKWEFTQRDLSYIFSKYGEDIEKILANPEACQKLLGIIKNHSTLFSDKTLKEYEAILKNPDTLTSNQKYRIDSAWHRWKFGVF
jgi:integrase